MDKRWHNSGQDAGGIYMDMELIKKTISEGENALKHHCMAELKKKLGHKLRKQESKQNLFLQITGLEYLLEKKLIQGGDVYDLFEQLIKKYPPVEYDDDNELIEFPFCSYYADIRLDDYILSLPVIAGSIAAMLIQDQLETTMFDDIESLYTEICFYINKPVYDFNNPSNDEPLLPGLTYVHKDRKGEKYDIYAHSVLMDLNKRGFSVWQIANLSRIRKDYFVDYSLDNLCELLSEMFPDRIDCVATWTLAGILYSIGKLKRVEQYSNLVDAIGKELKNRMDSTTFWEWKGVGKIFNTCLVIDAFNQLTMDPAFIQRARAWLTNQISVKRAENRGEWKHDLFDVEGTGWDVWTTVLALKAIAGPQTIKPEKIKPSPQENIDIPEAIREENRKYGYLNTYPIVFCEYRVVQIAGNRLELSELQFKLLLRFTYQLIVHPDSSGWIKLGTIKTSDKEHDEDDPKASLVTLGYVHNENPNQRIHELRRNLRQVHVADLDKIIEKKGSKLNLYRISSSPTLISFDWDAFNQCQDEKTKQLIQKIKKVRNA
jgi:hypothetical protein